MLLLANPSLIQTLAFLICTQSTLARRFRVCLSASITRGPMLHALRRFDSLIHQSDMEFEIASSVS